jgi:uncharacterized protein
LDWGRDLAGLVIGFVIASVTTPVGVSGAVFLLPIQLSVLNVPSPSVTPTNLLYNVIGGPGGWLRYRFRGQLDRELTRCLVSGSVPGVILGALIRIYVVSGDELFRALAAAVLAPVGVFILRRPRPGALGHRLRPRQITLLAFGVGVVGGIYGIGGGSLLGPILVGTGMAVTAVAPPALFSTWVTSIVGVATYTLVSLNTSGHVAPDWALGVATGLGGLAGGWTGASLQPLVPERALRTLLGVLALALAAIYLVEAAH